MAQLIQLLDEMERNIDQVRNYVEYTTDCDAYGIYLRPASHRIREFIRANCAEYVRWSQGFPDVSPEGVWMSKKADQGGPQW